MAVYEYNPTALENLKIEDTSVLDRLVDYRQAREERLAKDHSRRDKRLSLGEAVSEFVRDRDVISDSGFSYVRTSLQSYFEIVRQQKKNLQWIGSPNTNQSYGIPYGVTEYVHMSYTGAEMRGYDRNFSRQLKNGKVRILSEWSHGSMAQGFKAAQLGLPGVFSKQLLGSDIVKYNPYVKVMQHPMKSDPEPVVFIPALYPDVVFIHVHAADIYGNARFFGPAVNDLSVSAGARKVIITAEEIVSNDDIRYHNHGVQIPHIYVDAVVELPFGAVPGQMPGLYYWSRQWWEKMMRFACANDDNLKEFFDYWIIDSKDQFEFVEKLGGAKWIAESRRQTKAAEGDNEESGVDFSYEEWTNETTEEKWY